MWIGGRAVTLTLQYLGISLKIQTLQAQNQSIPHKIQTLQVQNQSSIYTQRLKKKNRICPFNLYATLDQVK